MYLTENFLFAAVLVAALLPLIGALWRAKPWSVHLLGLALVALLVLAATVRRPVHDLDLASSLPSSTDLEGMRSSSTCRGCHPGQYATWHQSFHRTMTQPAGPDSVVAPFDGRTLQARGRAFVVDRRDDEFWVTEVRPEDPPRASVRTAAKRVMMTTGSRHQQIYWTAAPDGSLVQFPWVYVIADALWVPSEDSFLHPDGWTQAPTKWNRDCIRCHSVGARPGFELDAGDWATQVAELGIACAGCHGPAEEHIRSHHDPLHRHRMRASDLPDPTIVNPKRLTQERSSAACGQCHAFATLPGGFHGDAWTAFQPGKDLEGHFEISKGPEDENSFWPDGAGRIGGREYNTMTLSGCYTDGEMTCLSCHTMHGDEPRDQLLPSMAGDEACLQCHEDLRARIAEHTFHEPVSSGSRCMNCHMPYTSYALLAAVRMHLVDSPSASGRTTRERPNACNLCHLDRTLAWTAERLTEWYGAPAAGLSGDHEEVAAAVLWALRGDAAQRVTVAWHMGESWALEASGGSWVTPYLALLLDDPYSAIRLIAHRSLRQLRGAGSIPYDHLGPAEERRKARDAVLREWARTGVAERTTYRASTLIDELGQLSWDRAEELYAQRDDHPLILAE